MVLTFLERKLHLREDFREKAQTKLAKLDKFFPQDAQGVIVVTAIKDKVTVEITVKCQSMLFRAEETDEDKFAALDRAIDIIIRQIKKNKTRLEKRYQQSSFVPDFGAGQEEEEKIDIVKTKRFPVKPMQVEEAVMQMNLLGHQFFMFRNASTNLINVVYKRKNGGYGLLEPTDTKTL